MSKVIKKHPFRDRLFDYIGFYGELTYLCIIKSNYTLQKKSPMKKLPLLLCVIALTWMACSQHSAKPNSNSNLRLMSYNIRNAKGMDNVLDCQRIADIIIREAPRKRSTA